MADIDGDEVVKIARQAVQVVQDNYERNGEDFILSLRMGFAFVKKELRRLSDVDMSVFDRLSTKVIDSLIKYTQGNVAYVYRSMSLWWSGNTISYNENIRNKNSNDILGAYGLLFELTNDIPMYRIREGTVGKNFGKHDMFAVPFSERRVLGNYRYSVSGYPCLYAGMSLYGCWEETRRLSFDNIFATQLRLKKTIESHNLLDLRLVRELTSQTALVNYIQTLPLIIACTIPVPKKYDTKDYPFKLEYAFPQFLMNAITQKPHYIQGKEIYGIIYTSTQCQGGIQKVKSPECDNIAIPVPSQREETNFMHQFEIKPPVHIAYGGLSTSVPVNLKTLENLLQQINYESL